jgi:hypothetical protein
MHQLDYISKVMDMAEAAVAPKSNVAILTIPGQNLIDHLGSDECVCLKCGISRPGVMMVRYRGVEHLTCENDCAYDDGREVQVFTQADFETGEVLAHVSEDEYRALLRKFPCLMAIAEAA